MRWLATLNGWVNRVAGIPDVLAGISILFIMFLVTADVFGRDFLNQSILGAYELVEYAMVVMVACALGVAQLNRFHIAVHVLVNYLPRRWRVVLDSATALAMLILFGVATWVGYEQAVVMAQRRLNSTILLIARWPFQAAMAVGLTLFCVIIARDFLVAAARALGKDSPAAAVNSEDHSI